MREPGGQQRTCDNNAREKGRELGLGGDQNDRMNMEDEILLLNDNSGTCGHWLSACHVLDIVNILFDPYNDPLTLALSPISQMKKLRSKCEVCPENVRPLLIEPECRSWHTGVPQAFLKHALSDYLLSQGHWLFDP